MNHGSLFSGIGGFDLAAEWMGWNNVFHCEINPFGQKVLKHYWPKSISYADITKTDFTVHRGQIDILTGGFPCQPFSLAGKRLGTADDRNLWPEYYRAIKEIQPVWVVGENVPGLINWSKGMVFEQVQDDLENAGYEVWPVILPACSVNAPHRRERVWFVAYSKSNGSVRASDATSQAIKRQGRNQTKQFNECSKVYASFTPNTNSNGLHDQPTQANNGNGKNNKQSGTQRERTIERFSDEWAVTNPNSGRQPSEKYRKTESGRFAEKSLSNNWQNFPTQSPVCSGDDGISSRLDGITFPKWRNESIKAYGNAIVPQVVYQIFKAIMEYEEATN